MPDLFDIDIAGLVDEHISPGLPDAKLIQSTPGTRDLTKLSGGTVSTTVSTDGKGTIVDYNDNRFGAGSPIKVGDRQVLLIGNSFAGKPVPKPDDQIFIEGATYNIVAVKRDPAAATYKCQVRL